MTARIVHTLAIASAAACYETGAMAQVPSAVAAPGEITVATFQGEGAQIYQCKAGNDGKLTWVFRERWDDSTRFRASGSDEQAPELSLCLPAGRRSRSRPTQ